MLPKFTYARATSIDNALAILNDRPALIHAGGTDLLGCLRDGIFSADTVVSLSAVKELQGVRPAADGSVRIGALTSISSLGASTLGNGPWYSSSRNPLTASASSFFVNATAWLGSRAGSMPSHRAKSENPSRASRSETLAYATRPESLSALCCGPTPG